MPVKTRVETPVKYWKQAAERDWKTARDLHKTKHYDACLFFCHLTLEKMLKGLVVRASREPAPYTHNLEKLAHIAKLALSEEQIDQLRSIITFNIAGRYQDDKSAFHKKATKRYCENWLDISQKLYLWLKRQYRR